MKITLLNYSDSEHGVKLSKRELGEFLERIKKDTKAGYVEGLRKVYNQLLKVDYYTHYNDIPRVCFQSDMQMKAGVPKMKSYTGLIALNVNNLNGRSEVDEIKAQAAMMPQTLAAFSGADGRSVIILVSATYPDGGLPDDEEKAQKFHAMAYQQAVLTYYAALKYPIDITFPELNQTFLMPLDEDPVIKERPTQFVLRQPEDFPKDELTDVRTRNHLLRLEAGFDTYCTFRDILSSIESAVFKQIRAKYENSNEEDHKTVMLREMAVMSAKHGIPEEEATRYLILHNFGTPEQEVRDEVRNAYIRHSTDRLTVFMPKNKQAAMQAQEFVTRRYDIRKNVVKGTTEFRPRSSMEFMYNELTTSHLNTICHAAALEGADTSDAAIKRFIFSNNTREYNPISEYLDNLPKWDGRDRIQEMIDLVPTNHPNWRELGCRWFLSMVDHWLHPSQKHANSTAPILIGGQGLRKSTYCRNILPPCFSEFYTDSIDFRNDIEAERFLSRFMLINIDEFDKLNSSQAAHVKHMFQKTQTAHRQLFSENIANHPRYASFIGTSNRYDILKDPTGSRRFLCLEVTDVIKTETPIDHDQLYAQAVAQINAKVRCYIDETDEAKITKENRKFFKRSPLEELFLKVFCVPEEEKDGMFMTPKEMMEELRKDGGFKSEMGRDINLGYILSTMDLKKKRTSSGNAYLVGKATHTEQE